MAETENGIETKEEVRERIWQVAYHLSSSAGADWVTLFREILGLRGLVRRTYRTPEKLAEFERSETYAEILQLLTRLREQTASPDDSQEPTRVITVRLPKSLHEAIRMEADEHHVSMNKLCISKLLQFIDHELIPKERWRRSSDPGPELDTEEEEMAAREIHSNAEEEAGVDL